MANRWYVVFDGDELGPLSDTGLERLIQGGRVDLETMVRNDTSGEWMSAAIAEELLAARPSRERPGDAAILAARQAKQSMQRPPAPPATISLSPSSSPPLPPASAPAAGAAPSTHESTTNESPGSPAPEPLASPAPGRSPLVWVGVAAGAAVIVTVSFTAGWFALHRAAPPSAVAPPPSAAPGVSPEVAPCSGRRSN